MDPVKIGSTRLGARQPPYVIAEIGSNHNGDMELCRDLIQAAAESGAHAAKFQSWSEDSLISQAEFQRNREYGDRKRHFGSLQEMVQAYQFTPAQHERAMAICRDSGIDFLSSAFSIKEVEMLASLGAPAVKIASMDVNHPLLLDAAAASGLPVLLSTGMATLREIAAAVERLQGAPFALMHCVSLYPADPSILNLRNIGMLRQAFDCPVGFSDHSTGIAAAIASVPLGCAAIEKHFTLDRDLPGWDHWMSADPEEMKALCEGVQTAFLALGHEARSLTDEEIEKRKAFRRCIVLVRPVRMGEVLELQDLDFKRPGTGIDPDQFGAVVGRTVARDLPREHELAWSDLK